MIQEPQNIYLAQNPGCNPSCRACHYKAFDYDEQLRRKQEWAASRLEPWAKVLKPILPAPGSERLAYRSKTWLRSSFQEGELSFGMYRAKQIQGKWEQEFVSWDTCPIHARPIQETIASVRKALAVHAPDFCSKSLFGIWMGSPHLVIVARDPEVGLLHAMDWKALLSHPFDQVWLHCTSQLGRSVFNHGRFDLIWGVPTADAHPIRAFRQISQSLLVEARELARSHLLQGNPSLVVDLYCGTGELSQLIPPSVSWLGIELSKHAVAYAGKLRVPSESVMHEAFTGTVEHRLQDPRVIQKITARYALYLNPPRSGLSEEARDRIAELIRKNPPACVVFLSCSASSLARDLPTFEGLGYRVKLLQPYDFFPQTEHFETLAVLDRPE